MPDPVSPQPMAETALLSKPDLAIAGDGPVVVGQNEEIDAVQTQGPEPMIDSQLQRLSSQSLTKAVGIVEPDAEPSAVVDVVDHVETSNANEPIVDIGDHPVKTESSPRPVVDRGTCLLRAHWTISGSRSPKGPVDLSHQTQSTPMLDVDGSRGSKPHPITHQGGHLPDGGWVGHHAADQPRPTKGISVAMIVIDNTLDSGGSPAM